MLILMSAYNTMNYIFMEKYGRLSLSYHQYPPYLFLCIPSGRYRVGGGGRPGLGLGKTTLEFLMFSFLLQDLKKKYVNDRGFAPK